MRAPEGYVHTVVKKDAGDVFLGFVLNGIKERYDEKDSSAYKLLLREFKMLTLIGYKLPGWSWATYLWVLASYFYV